MAVLNTTSPTVVPLLPMELPIKTVPSASAKIAGGNAALRDESTGFSERGRVARRPQKCALQRILRTALLILRDYLWIVGRLFAQKLLILPRDFLSALTKLEKNP